MKRLPKIDFELGDKVKSKRIDDNNTYVIEDFIYSVEYEDWFVEYSKYECEEDNNDDNVITRDLNYFLNNMVKI